MFLRVTSLELTMGLLLALATSEPRLHLVFAEQSKPPVAFAAPEALESRSGQAPGSNQSLECF